jgi:hypothetical protein
MKQSTLIHKLLNPKLRTLRSLPPWPPIIAGTSRGLCLVPVRVAAAGGGAARGAERETTAPSTIRSKLWRSCCRKEACTSPRRRPTRCCRHSSRSSRQPLPSPPPRRRPQHQRGTPATGAGAGAGARARVEAVGNLCPRRRTTVAGTRARCTVGTANPEPYENSLNPKL